MPNQFKYPNYTPDIFMLFSYQVNQWSTAESIYVSKLYTKHLGSANIKYFLLGDTLLNHKCGFSESR